MYAVYTAYAVYYTYHMLCVVCICVYCICMLRMVCILCMLYILWFYFVPLFSLDRISEFQEQLEKIQSHSFWLSNGFLPMAAFPDAQAGHSDWLTELTITAFHTTPLFCSWRWDFYPRNSACLFSQELWRQQLLSFISALTSGRSFKIDSFNGTQKTNWSFLNWRPA